MLVIVDADALIATIVPSDKHHAIAEFIVKYCQAKGIRWIIPSTAICEAIKVLHHKKEKDDATYARPLYDLIQIVKTSNFKIESIDKNILIEAITRFKPDGSKSDSIFDAIVATLAIRYAADAVFSFDHIYPNMGLRLAKDLFS